MSRYTPIQRSQHQSAGYSSAISMAFAQKMATVPLLKEELSHVLGEMPIGFIKRGDSDDAPYELVAIQSLGMDANLFVHPDGRWLGTYKPAFYRSYPFILQPGAEKGQLQLCIESSHLKEAPAEDDLRFFDPEGQLTTSLSQLLNFLQQCLQSRGQTAELCAQLASAELIVPWKILFQHTTAEGQQEKASLEGLYHIDQKALKALEGPLLQQLNASGALDIAHAQSLSEPRLKLISTLQQVRQNLDQQALPQEEPDLEALFSDDDELFKF